MNYWGRYIVHSDTVKTFLLPALSSLDAEISRVKLYIFGSILQPDSIVNDIDILVVYEFSSELDRIRYALDIVSHRFPMHITYMSTAEETQFDFVRQQHAKRVCEMSA